MRGIQPYQYSEYEDLDTGQVHEYAGTLVVTDAGVWVESQTERHLAIKKRMEERSVAQAVAGATGVKRGGVQEFSRASQRRLQTVLSGWQFLTRPCMLTLTYPAQHAPPKISNRLFRKMFLQRLLRAFPHLGALWRLEYQIRGAVHYHLIIDGVADEQERQWVERWAKKNWRDCRGAEYSHEKEDVERNRLEWITHEQAAKFYLTKEVGKSIQGNRAGQGWKENAVEVEHYGRFWGFHNKAVLQFHHKEYSLPRLVAERFADAIQFRVQELMKKAGRIVQDKSGQWVMVKSKRPVERWKLQRWLLVTDGSKFAQRVWESLDWQYLCEVFGWADPPSLDFFEIPTG
jgi:hypothetical protein